MKWVNASKSSYKKHPAVLPGASSPVAIEVSIRKYVATQNEKDAHPDRTEVMASQIADPLEPREHLKMINYY
jgi:hypothetical protein